MHKIKISQSQKKMAESDRQKQLAVFEKEKQEARWNTERNTYEQKLDEFRQALEKEKSEGKKLLKDLEKLKLEKKKNTSYIKQNQTTIMAREMSSENKENSQMQ